DEEEVPQAATPLSHQEAVLEENVIVTDPPARQVEVEHLEAATTNTTEATDTVMAEANVEPSPQKHQKSAKPLIPPLLFLSLLSVPSLTIMLSTSLRYRSQSQDCQGSQVLHQHLAPSISMASEQTTHSLTAPGTPTLGKEYHVISSGVIRSEAITH
ncbi:hypothetical protein PSTG_20091, partial [Puccinia striiformis f. sp. tritici PST-78]